MKKWWGEDYKFITGHTNFLTTNLKYLIISQKKR
jgi:hypothetical protein